MYTEKNPGGESSGNLSAEVDPPVKTLEQLEKEISGYQTLIENMTRSGENVDPKELQEARDRLTELRKDLQSRQDLAK